MAEYVLNETALNLAGQSGAHVVGQQPGQIAKDPERKHEPNRPNKGRQCLIRRARRNVPSPMRFKQLGPVPRNSFARPSLLFRPAVNLSSLIDNWLKLISR